MNDTIVWSLHKPKASLYGEFNSYLVVGLWLFLKVGKGLKRSEVSRLSVTGQSFYLEDLQAVLHTHGIDLFPIRGGSPSLITYNYTYNTPLPRPLTRETPTNGRSWSRLQPPPSPGVRRDSKQPVRPGKGHTHWPHPLTCCVARDFPCMPCLWKLSTVLDRYTAGEQHDTVMLYTLA